MDFRLQLTNAAAGLYATPKGKNTIFSALNLQSQFSSSNMHLWGPDGTIKRYEGPEEIIRDFCPARLRFYELRKESLERKLTATVTELQNKHRFCSMVVDGSLNLFRKNRADVEQMLSSLEFDPHPERGGFAYLTGTSLMDLTSEKLEDLAAKLAARSQQLKELIGKTPQALWADDLTELRAKLVQR